MTSVVLASVTRRLAQVTLQPLSKALVASSFQSVSIRCKTSGKKNKAAGKKEDPTEKHDNEEQQPNLLQQEWVKLQKSIAVDGFDTGQITKATLTGKKKRGGKQMRRRREKEAELAETARDREKALELGGGQFPPLRYSDEETERLLAMAYAAIPERAGKRGTRNLKRQNLRWFYVRRARAKQKLERIAAHERKMAKRSRRIKEVLAVKKTAPEIRARDKAYQEEVLRRWAENMTAGYGEEVVEEKEQENV